MIFSRLRSMLILASRQLLKSGLLIFIYINSLICIASLIFFIYHIDSLTVSGSAAAFSTSRYVPMIIWALNSLCTALLIVLRRKCQSCQQLAGKQIVTALDKMSKGDLDWKLTLRRNTELAEVADSVNKAQELLTQRISSLQLKTKEISEVEDFLFDSIQCDKSFRPHTLKALRKLNICLNRLKSDVDDFELSLNSDNKEYSKTAPFV